jgi:hypothetical protein
MRQRNGMTGMTGGERNQLALRRIVIDDQELERAALAAIRRVGPGLR